MASPTLLESAVLSQDQLVIGIIENIITVDRFFEILPFDAFSGNALAYDRELTLGNVVVSGVGDSISSATNPITGTANGKLPATFQQVTSTLTTIIGDAEMNGLIQATRSDKQDQTEKQVASKAKYIGQVYQWMLANGIGSANQFSGLLRLCAAGQKVDTGVNGSPLSFDLFDELLDAVTDKNGVVDYITMHQRTLRSYYALLRALGGAGIGDTITLPSGKTVPQYRGVPIFANNNLPINATKGGTIGSIGYVLAGTLDEDNNRQNGIAGLTAQEYMGINVEDVGVSETKDEKITRVKWYCGLALFSEKGLAMLDGVTN
jgi:hypothetical protein